MAKSKKNRQKDFQKVKLKVGKKLKKADNVTNASFKTRAIQITQQLKTGDTTLPTTKKRQNIKDLLSQCRHYSTSGRVEAVTGLKELVTSNPDIVPTHLSDILERIAEFFTDKEVSVRQGGLRLFKVLLQLVAETQISPFFPLFCAHLSCAMTHIHDSIQVDSLAVLDLLLEHYPRLMICKSNQVLSNFLEQISRQQGQGQAKRSLSTNPNSATSSVKWRNSVLNRLQKFLSALLKYHAVSAGNQPEHAGNQAIVTSVTMTTIYSEYEVTQVEPFPSYMRNQWVMPGYTLSTHTKTTDSSSDLIGGKLADFVNTLIPLLIECWIESAPSKDKNKLSGADNSLAGDDVCMMYNVLQVTQLLLECSILLSTQEEGNPVNREKFMREFDQHFMAGFPYNVNTRVSKKGKKQQLDSVQVSAESLNLAVCDIMTYFIGGKSTNHQPQSHDPAWLPLVTRFLNDFLKGKYGKTGIGQFARIVVNILNRLISRETVAESVIDLVDEIYLRFQSGNISSTEKRVYLQFFSDQLLDNQTHCIRPKTRTEFLQCLPELLPLCTKENKQMASLIVNTMKKGACQKCVEFLDSNLFRRVGKQWFDPQEGVITRLSVEDQRNLIGILYSVPDIGLDLVRTLVSLARCSELSDSTVAFLVQVLQNRFLRNEMSQNEAIVHIGYLVNLLLGISQTELESLQASSTSGLCPVLSSYKIVPDPVLDELGDNTDFDRNRFLVEVVTEVVQQFNNTGQVVELMLDFIQKTLKSLPQVPLQMVFGVCKFAEALTDIPSRFNSLGNNLGISLVSHMITWEHSTNQNTVQLMLDLGCRLLMKSLDGVPVLISMATECFGKDLSTENMTLILKAVMIFLTVDRQPWLKARPECIQKLDAFQTSLQTFVTKNKGMVSMETEKLISNFNYLVSCVK